MVEAKPPGDLAAENREPSAQLAALPREQAPLEQGQAVTSPGEITAGRPSYEKSPWPDLVGSAGQASVTRQPSPPVAILNVDDHEIGRYAKSRILRQAGFTVHEAATGAEALRLVVQERPALVLLDVQLPDLSGWEVCRRIKSDPALASTLVLHISAAFISSRDKTRGLEGGADAYLTEPVEPEELVATAQALLRLRQTEQALQQSEERYRQLVETAPDMVFVNIDDRIAYINPAGVKLLGADSPEQLLGRPVFDIFHPDFHALIRKRLPQIRQGAIAPLIEEKIVRLDGIVREVEVTAARVRFAGQAAIQVIVRDISARKQVEEALWLSQALAQNRLDELGVVYNTAPVGLCVLDRELRFVRINERLAEMNGFTLAEHLGKTVREMVPQVANQMEPLLRQVLSSGQPLLDIEIVGETAAQPGVTRTWLENWYPLRSSDGQIVGLNIVAEEVTERRRSEAALQRAHKRFAAAEAAANGFVYEIDFEMGRVERSPNFTTVTGYQPAEIEPTAEWWSNLIHPDDYERVRQAAELSFTSRTASSALEYRIRRRDGQYIYLWDQSQVIRDEAGHMKGLIGTSVDITARKRNEESQRLLAEAGQALAASFEVDMRLATVARLITRHLADWCAVTLVEEDQTLRLVTLTHADPANAELAVALQEHYPPLEITLSATAQVLETGQARLYPELTAAMIAEAVHDPDQLQRLHRVGLRSAMVVPLTARGRVLGSLALASAKSERRYDDVDLALAEELGRRVAIAVDNVRLYQAEQAARQSAERTMTRIMTLQVITAALSRALTATQVTEVVVREGLAAFGADAGIVQLITPDGAALETVQALGYPPELIKTVQRIPLTAPIPGAEVARSGEPLWLESSEAFEAAYPHLAEARAATGYESVAIAPLQVDRRTLGVMALSFVEPRSFSAADRAFIEALAQQCAQALDRARSYESEKQARLAAELAQQSLALLAEIRERNRLAQELHDNVAQALGYLNLRTAMAQEQVATHRFDEAMANLQELKQVIGEAYTDIRGEIFNLRAASDLDVNFLATLRQYIDKYKRFYQLEIQLLIEADEAVFDLPSESSVALIRTIQEALMNVRKHASVNQALLRLEQEADHLRISIEDQGRGFDLARTLANNVVSYGLQIMQERIESAGGRLEISTAPGQGTRVSLSYPRASAPKP